MDVPNADLFGIDPITNRLGELCEVSGSAMFLDECLAVIVGFVEQYRMWLVGHGADVKLMTPGFEFL